MGSRFGGQAGCRPLTSSVNLLWRNRPHDGLSLNALGRYQMQPGKQLAQELAAG
jgi:hypothetical protein